MRASELNDLDSMINFSPTVRHRVSNGEKIGSKKVIEYIIPSWCDFEIEEEIFIREDENKNGFVAEKNGEVILSDTDLVSLYDKVSEISRNIGMYKDSLDLTLSMNTNGRFLVSVTDLDKVLNLKSQIVDFLKIAKIYHKNPKNFINAYRFVTGHIIFWSRGIGAKDWDTHFTPWLEVWTNKKGKVKYLLEAGEHIPDSNYTEHYHNPSLDAIGGTFDKAMIKLAKNISTYYNDDGTNKKPKKKSNKSKSEKNKKSKKKEVKI